MRFAPVAVALALAFSLCACGAAPTPAPQCADAVTLATAPDSASTPDIVPNSAPVPDSAPTSLSVPPGRYWVRRTRPGLGSILYSAHGDPVITHRGNTECVEFEVGPGDRYREVTLGGTARLSYRQRDEGWQLSGAWVHLHPRFMRTIELSRACTTALVTSSGQPLGGLLRTSQGPLFMDLESCQDAPSSYEQTCRGPECAFDDWRAAPVSLGECDAALSALGTRLQPLLDATHDEALDTMERVQRMSRQGGLLYSVAEDTNLCVPVMVRRIGENRMQLRSDYRLSGERVETETELRFEPLFRQATGVYDTETRTGPDGVAALGMSGSGSNHASRGLYFGAGFFYLGSATFFLRRADCQERAAPHEG